MNSQFIKGTKVFGLAFALLLQPTGTSADVYKHAAPGEKRRHDCVNIIISKQLTVSSLAACVHVLEAM